MIKGDQLERETGKISRKSSYHRQVLIKRKKSKDYTLGRKSTGQREKASVVEGREYV